MFDKFTKENTMIPLDNLKGQTTREFQLLLSQIANWILSQKKEDGSFTQGMYLSRMKEQVKAPNPKADSFKDGDNAWYKQMKDMLENRTKNKMIRKAQSTINILPLYCTVDPSILGLTDGGLPDVNIVIKTFFLKMVRTLAYIYANIGMTLTHFIYFTC
jgi:hypothetical protein